MTREQILEALAALVASYDPDDCINWGDQAIETLADILDANKEI